MHGIITGNSYYGKTIKAVKDQFSEIILITVQFSYTELYLFV